ncbi:DUF2946 family protein [Azospirillum brasilense]|uniref:DUF2946 family protein n=1 Tax=Azospirillum brasilense TaxID=192 RepID=UPI000E0C744F|nr:DUF2946 family protein [Azospirillum brasilense]
MPTRYDALAFPLPPPAVGGPLTVRRTVRPTTRRTGARLRAGMLCGLILLLIGQVLAAALPAPPSGRAPRFAQDLLGDRIVICTAAGLVVIDRETGAPVPADGAPGHDPAADFCQFCLPILHGKAATPVVGELPLPAVGVARCEPPPAIECRTAGRRFGAAWPRGPPLSRSL